MSYSKHNLEDTIVALATPPGIGAIGVVRLSGKESIAIIDSVFKGKNLREKSSHTIHFGTIRNEQDKVIDEVLVSLFIAPHSYTGENVVEVSCHGSSYIEQELIQLFIAKGARLAQPGEFTLRAFLNGKMDLSQAEAVADLIASSSAVSHDIAIRQMRGGFSDEIQKLRQQLIDFASLIELELDFAEEDVEFANRKELKTLVQKIQSVLHSLIQSFQLGNVIKNGVNTVIAGRPNAGKSTLLNALLNEERAIVSEIPGTTRDTIEEILNINGIEFRLIDTAGIRDAQDQIEAAGVQKTMEKIQQSALLVYVFDVSALTPEELQEDLQKLAKNQLHTLIVANKMDRNPYASAEEFLPTEVDQESEDMASSPHPPSLSTPPQTPNSELRTSNSEPQTPNSELQTSNPELHTPHSTPIPPPPHHSNWIPISAIHKMNIPYLKERLYQAVIDQKINLESTIVTNARHFEALQKAHDSLSDVLRGMDEGITSDFIAMDIRQALSFLGEITGEISTEDLLGNIFGKFCIGK